MRALEILNAASMFGVVARIVTGPHDAHRQNPHRPMQYDTGRPRAVIRLRISQPRTTCSPPGPDGWYPDAFCHWRRPSCFTNVIVRSRAGDRGPWGRDVRRLGRWDDDRRTPRPGGLIDGDRVIGRISGDAHERALDRLPVGRRDQERLRRRQPAGILRRHRHRRRTRTRHRQRQRRAGQADRHDRIRRDGRVAERITVPVGEERAQIERCRPIASPPCGAQTRR